MQVIPNGVDLKALDPGPIQTGFPPRLIFAGRFMQQKNPLQLVRTLSSLQDLQWQCVMLGDGPLREERFQLLGWVAPEEVISWFARSDVLFMPSLSEGLPVAGVQALAMGLAIVASRVGGFVDLVEPGENGYLINADDTESYSIVLRELIENPVKLQSFKEASRLKANCFDIEKVVDAYEDIMMDVINGK
jgi:glycosyltransferase involved in cell wall biosynthesis